MWSSLNRTSSSSARSVFDRSCDFQSAGINDRESRSPTCPVAPSSMFSITVIFESALVNWKVRTIPRLATRWAATPSRSRPLNERVPVSGLSKFVSRLKKVVFPAPFGPMSAVITPRCTSRWSTSTAVSPPKVRRTPVAVRIASGFGAPGSQATPASAGATGMESAVIERHLLLVAEQALRSEGSQQDQAESDEHEPDLADLSAGHEPLGDVSVVHSLA